MLYCEKRRTWSTIAKPKKAEQLNEKTFESHGPAMKDNITEKSLMKSRFALNHHR